MLKKLVVILIFFISSSTLAQRFKTGRSFDFDKTSKVPQAATLTTRSFDDLPAAYSLKKYCPVPNNQERQSSCVGWSTAYSARTMLESIELDRTDARASANEAFSPSYIYNQIKVDPASCDGGSAIPVALNMMTLLGAVKLRDFPYVCNKMPTNEDHLKALKNSIQDYVRLTPNKYIDQFTAADKITTKNNIKKAIAAKSPVVIGMYVTKSFDASVNTPVWNGVLDEVLGGHAMCLVGYDDNKYGGAFEIMNSWGTSWGDKGYIWMKYDDFLSVTDEAYQLIGNVPEEPVQPEPVVVKPEPKPITPEPVVVKPDPVPTPSPTPNGAYDMVGRIRLVKDNNQEIALVRGAGMRDFDIEEVEKPVYQSAQPIKTGDRFRIYFKAEKGAYIYIISYGSVSRTAKPIYPFKNFSAYLTAGGNNEVAIPNENFYIKVDDKVGTDFMTFVYSQKPIDIQEVCNKINGGSSADAYITRMKQAFAGEILFSKDVDFTLPQAGFNATTNGRKILPLTIQFEHQ
jgi:C1A family cysteine protease